jgi:hypothetical protein
MVDDGLRLDIMGRIKRSPDPFDGRSDIPPLRRIFGIRIESLNQRQHGRR